MSVVDRQRRGDFSAKYGWRQQRGIGAAAAIPRRSHQYFAGSYHRRNRADFGSGPVYGVQKMPQTVDNKGDRPCGVEKIGASSPGNPVHS